MKEQDDGAALLPVDPLAPPTTTEALPNSVEDAKARLWWAVERLYTRPRHTTLKRLEVEAAIVGLVAAVQGEFIAALRAETKVGSGTPATQAERAVTPGRSGAQE